MVAIEIVINSTHVMVICVTISCRYCIAFQVMLLFLHCVPKKKLWSRSLAITLSNL